MQFLVCVVLAFIIVFVQAVVEAIRGDFNSLIGFGYLIGAIAAAIGVLVLLCLLTKPDDKYLDVGRGIPKDDAVFGPPRHRAETKKRSGIKKNDEEGKIVFAKKVTQYRNGKKIEIRPTKKKALRFRLKK